MKLKNLINISETYFRKKNRFRLQVFTVFSLLFFLLFFIITFSSTFHATIKKIFSTENNTYITIAPKEMDVGVLRFNTPSIFGKGELDDGDVKYFEGLNGVKAVSPTYTLDAPAHLSGKLIDMGYGTDLSLFGEDRPFEGIWYNKKDLNHIRAIASSKLIDIYNSSFAPANDLPKMTEKILIGRKFDLLIGRSSIRGGENMHKSKVTIVSLDKEVPFLGLTVPALILKEIANAIKRPVIMNNIKVYFENSSQMINQSEVIEKKGYRILENENDIFSTINKYISKLDYFLFLPVSFIILIIVFFVQVQIRYMLLYLKREIGIQMAMGAYEKDIIVIWVYQYAKYILSGLITGAGLAFLITRIFISSLPDSVIIRMITPEFNINIFMITSLSLFLAALLYVYIKIRNFLMTRSIIDLMSNE
ncbi:MAG: hypothetical protein R6V47_07450 [Candidatus Delongbacteria bacterium]